MQTQLLLEVPQTDPSNMGQFGSQVRSHSWSQTAGFQKAFCGINLISVLSKQGLVIKAVATLLTTPEKMESGSVIELLRVSLSWGHGAVTGG